MGFRVGGQRVRIKVTRKQGGGPAPHRQSHGERVRAYAEDAQIWDRLDFTGPGGNPDPEDGFSATAIEIAKQGKFVRV